MSDMVTAWIRTIVPKVWLGVVALLLQAWAGAPEALIEWLNAPVTIALVSFGVLAVWDGVWRWLEPKLPLWLDSVMFGIRTQPTYTRSELTENS